MNHSRLNISKPWYREPWPWIIIGLLGSVIIASLLTAWIAFSNPDALVVEEGEYQKIRSDLRAQDPSEASQEANSEHREQDSDSD